MRNSRRAGLLAAVFMSGFVTTAMPASAESLADAIALAFKTNPALLIQRGNLRNGDEAYYRSRATNLGPGLTADLGLSAGSTTDFLHGDRPGDNTNSNIAVTASATATQTILSGGSKAAAVDSQTDALLSLREGLRSSEQTLLQQVVNAYTGVRNAERQVTISQQQLQSVGESLDQAKAKFQAGAATITDQALAESRVAQSQTSLTTAQNNLNNARITYLTVIGQMPGTLQQEPTIAASLPATKEAAYEIAQRNSPTLRQAYLTERQSALAVVTARAAKRPTVSLSTGPSLGDTVRFPGAPNSVFGLSTATGTWTSSVRLSMPIYPGRTTESTIRSAEETNRQDGIRSEQARRTLNQQVNTAWNALIAARAQKASQTEAVRAQTLATEGTIEQYKQGLSTALDQLNSQLDLRTTQQALVNAEFSEYTAGVSLLVAMGQISPETFGATVEAYDPLEHFNQINGNADLPWMSFVENLDRSMGAPVRAYTPAPGEIVPDFKAP